MDIDFKLNHINHYTFYVFSILFSYFCPTIIFHFHGFPSQTSIKAKVVKPRMTIKFEVEKFDKRNYFNL